MATFDTEKIFEGKFIDIKKYRFTFGKYKNELLKDIMKTDPSYIVWCHENINWFSLSKKDIKKISSLAEKQRRNRRRTYYDYDAVSNWEGTEYFLEVYGNDAPF